MSDFIINIARGGKLTDADIAHELHEICDREHSSCNYDCPVWRLNGGRAPGSNKPFVQNRGCDTFKNGKAMLAFIRAMKMKP